MNYISLGYFCSVASELEKLGLRTESSPFDWVISDFEGVLLAIQNNFSDYLNYSFLAQNKQNHSVYKNIKYNGREKEYLCKLSFTVTEMPPESQIQGRHLLWLTDLKSGSMVD